MKYVFDTKFKVGEVLYTLICKKITEVEIEKIEANITIADSDVYVINIKYYLRLHDYTHKYLGFADEEDLYRTKEELIDNL